MRAIDTIDGFLPMTVGDSSVFLLLSEIVEAYSSPFGA
jgi:hypothetical protein